MNHQGPQNPNVRIRTSFRIGIRRINLVEYAIFIFYNHPQRQKVASIVVIVSRRGGAGAFHHHAIPIQRVIRTRRCGNEELRTHRVGYPSCQTGRHPTLFLTLCRCQHPVLGTIIREESLGTAVVVVVVVVCSKQQPEYTRAATPVSHWTTGLTKAIGDDLKNQRVGVKSCLGKLQDVLGQCWRSRHVQVYHQVAPSRLQQQTHNSYIFTVLLHSRPHTSDRFFWRQSNPADSARTHSTAPLRQRECTLYTQPCVSVRFVGLL